MIDTTGKIIIPLKYDYIRGKMENSFSTERPFYFPPADDLEPRGSFPNSVLKGMEHQKIMKRHLLKDPFSEGLARVLLNGKWGFINKKGAEVIPPQYEDAISFEDGLARVRLNKKWGMINKTGETVIPFEYYFIYPFVNNEAEAYTGKYTLERSKLKLKYGKINKKGEITEAFKNYKEKKIDYSAKFGYKNMDGKEIIPPIYDKPIKFHRGLAIVHLNGRQGLMNLHGHLIIPIEYDYFGYQIGDELIIVRLDGKYGFFNIKENKLQIPANYDNCNSFSEGLASVKKGDAWGYIDTNNKVVIPFIYINVSAFENGVAKVWKFVTVYGKGQVSQKFYINKKGEIIGE